MSGETWRPLGVDTEDQIAAYDALHDGVPTWMEAAFWAWVHAGITVRLPYPDGSGAVPMLNTELAEQMCQTLRIALPNLRPRRVDSSTGTGQLSNALRVLQQHWNALQIADYLLAHGRAKPEGLEELLARNKSAWAVGTRSGLPGLVRRVPLGVQVAADSVMARAGRAGVRLAMAWEELFGLVPNPSEAYRVAIQAVEDAAVPVVSPTNTSATLGTLLAQIEDQKD